MRKFLPFIIILSLLVPFLPSFDYSLFALPYTPSESENSWIDDLEIKFQTYLGNNGVVANSDWYNRDYVGGFWDDLLTYCGFEKIPDKDYASSVYEYAITNNQSADMIFNDSAQFIQNIVESEIPYNIYTIYHKSDLKSLIYNFGNQEASWLTKFTLPSDDNCIYFVYVPNNYLVWGDSNNSNPLEVISVPLEFFENYQFYCKTNNFSSEFFNTDNFFYKVPVSQNNMTKPVFTFWCVSDNNIPSSLTFNQRTYHVWSGSIGSPQPTPRSYFAYLPLYSYCSTNRVYNYLYGGFFIAPDNVDTFSFAIYKDYASVFDFLNGDSLFYKFNSSIEIPDNVSGSINYDRLYDLISDSLASSTGNALDIINHVADKYLQQQLDLLHDINNALNDGDGQSWLRRIYGILDYNFPLTLNSFQDLIEAVQNISVSGGGGDFSEATQVLHDIDTKLGILIDEPFTDLTDDDWNSMKSRVQTKFPFCIFSDIVAISVILNRPPQQPDLNFVVPIMGTESENMVHIDLSPYEHARPYVHGVLIFVFIIGLLALSVKIFDHLKS